MQLCWCTAFRVSLQYIKTYIHDEQVYSKETSGPMLIPPTLSHYAVSPYANGRGSRGMWTSHKALGHTSCWLTMSLVRLPMKPAIYCCDRRTRMHSPGRKTDYVNTLVFPSRRAWTIIKVPRFKNHISNLNKLAGYDIWTQTLDWYEILTNKTFIWFDYSKIQHAWYRW